MLVIDASITIAWIVPDGRSALARAVRDRVLAEGALVPSIWTLEIVNVLAVAGRQGRMSGESVTKALALLRQLPITVVPGTPDDLDTVAAASRDHGLSAYEAAYLTLARREGLALATLDHTASRPKARAYGARWGLRHG
jgi:predicted nucleic acid-binding protein